MSKAGRKTNIPAAALFASFMFLQYVILRMSNRAGSGYLPEGRVEYVYYLLQVCAILGFLFFALTQRLLRRPAHRRAALSCAVGVCYCGAAAQFVSDEASLFYLIVTALTVCSLGFVGGAVYLRMADYTARGVKVGLCMGVGCSVALALQYFLQLRFTVKPALGVCAAAAFGVLVFLFRRPPEKDAEAPENSAQTDARALRARQIVCAIVITLAMLVFTGYYNNYIHHLQVASGYEQTAYTWPRLLMIPGFLLLGFIGDIRRGKFLPLASLCVVLVALLNTVLTGKNGTYWLNMCLFYVALSAGICYYNLTFWRIAARSARPALLAPMGRMLDSFEVLLTFFVGQLSLSTAGVLAVNVAALAVIIALMAVNGDFNILPLREKQPENAPPPDAAAADDDAFARIGARYTLTPSELKVFRELVLTEDKQSAIGDRLSIKVRTVQANVTAIYRKTGVGTRAGLVRLYHDMQANG